jgi:putative endonuclease
MSFLTAFFMSNNSYFVYILYSKKFNKFYIGQTANVERRILQHNVSEENTFTSKYRPWILKLALKVSDRSTAMKIEKYIKGRKSKIYINKLIAEEKLQNKLIKKFSSAG